MAASALQRSVRTGSCCTNARYGDGVHAYKVSVDDTVHAHTERVLTIAPHLHFQNVQTGSKLRLEEVVDDLPSLRLIVKVPVSVPVSEWGARTSLSQHQCFHACINVFSAHVHACCVGWKAASFTPAWDGRQPASHLRGMEGSQLHTCVGWKAASFTPARARYQRIVEATRTSSQKCMRSASYSAASKGRHS
jgi:hypothetical protein